jgi:phage shock protein E
MTKLMLLINIMLLSLCSSIAFGADYFIDVRSNKEYVEDHIPGNLNIVHSDILQGVKAHNIQTSDHIYIYCRSGKRASIAQKTLNDAGYHNTTNLGGIEDARKFLATYNTDK